MLTSLNYPLNSEFIMRKKKTIKKQLLENNNFMEKKIAILGGSTTFHIREILELFLLNTGIKPAFYESDYNQYYEEAFFSKELEEFQPVIIYIHTSTRNFHEIPDILKSDEENNEILEREYLRFEQMWKKLKERFSCIIIQNNFEYPEFRPSGNLERTLNGGLVNFISKMNMKLAQYSQKNPAFLVNDINYISSYVGLNRWHDLNLWYGFKYALSFEAIPYLTKNIANIIKAVYGKTQKCLVLDLDNTLWGGIIGDDGVDNIKIGKENAVSEAYTAFQNYVKDLKNRGVILAVSSKNDDHTAREGLNHPDMVLKEKDFLVIKANWEPKFMNIQDIAKEINIGMDSLVFIDDNPVERDSVKTSLGEIKVPNVGSNVVDFINHLDKNAYFEPINISREDLNRGDYYKNNIQRKEEENLYSDYNEFLKSLDMTAEIDYIKPVYKDRICQLINKTNQFNLTTKRYTLSEVEELLDSHEKICIYARLKDKFGDNGLISVLIGSIKERELHIDLWIMSCRVLKRNLELAVFDKLTEYCKENGIGKIHGYYYPTPKNGMVKNHYDTLGFSRVENGLDEGHWTLKVDKNTEKLNSIIKIEKY